MRADVDFLCGGCARHIERGFPVFVRMLANVKKPRLRGECCAGSAPPDLPGISVTASSQSPQFSPLNAIAPIRTRGALKEMAREWLPHPND